MAQNLATLEDRTPADPKLAAERAARTAWQQRANDAEIAAVRFQEEAATAKAEIAGLRAELIASEREAARQHRIGYLEARWKYALGALGGGILLTLGVGELNSRFEVARQERAVRVGNEAFGRGVAVGNVQRETSEPKDDAGYTRGREPASAPR